MRSPPRLHCTDCYSCTGTDCQGRGVAAGTRCAAILEDRYRVGRHRWRAEAPSRMGLPAAFRPRRRANTPTIQADTLSDRRRPRREERTRVDSMNKRERVDAALRGAAVDRAPISFWGHDYIKEWTAEGLAEAMLANYRTYDWDYMKVNPRASYHVEDWGATLQRTTDPNRGHTFT